MRIIEKGKLPEERLWLGTCYNCKSKIEAKEKELSNIGHDQRDGWYGDGKCPLCKKTMSFKLVSG